MQLWWELVQAVTLGLVQGITEFLPISSSGHLVVVPYLFSWPQPSLAFDVALHAATLVAIVAFFFADIVYLATRPFGIGTDDPAEVTRARRTVALLAVGTAPAAILGVAVGGVFERAFAQPLWVAAFFLLTAALLYAAERVRRARVATLVPAGPEQPPPSVDPGRDESRVGWTDAVVVGLAQALALFPGVSRAGATIAAGMFRGMSREGATRFSFLLAIPILAGATVVQVPALFDPAGGSLESYSALQVVVASLVAGVSAYWAIGFLLRFVVTDELTGFARYLVAAAALVAVGHLWLGPPSTV